jgi:hypothetical protein
MPLQILTDEHVSPEVARRLVALGFHVISVRDRRMLGWKDWELMRWCRERRHAICTKDGPDLAREHERCLAHRTDHAGVIILGGDWTPDCLPPERLSGLHPRTVGCVSVTARDRTDLRSRARLFRCIVQN